MRTAYIPFLHAKKGEFEALRHASKEQRATMLPLFDIGLFTAKLRESPRYRNEPAPTCAYLECIADGINDAISGPVMVDTSQWPADEATETGEVAIAYAVQALLERGQVVVPVVGLDRWDSEEYREAMAALDVDEEATWALRLDSSDIEDAADPTHFLERVEDVTRELGLRASQVGILMDFGDVTGQTREYLVAQADLVLRLLGPAGYQFYTIAGCSMPSTIDKAIKKRNAEGTLLRKEMRAWHQLREMHRNLPLAFGDYGVRGPRTSDVQNPNTNGKIRYSIQNNFYIVRGEARRKGDGQMHRLANIVASSEHFQGPRFSWGDHELYRRAMRENIGKRKPRIIGGGGSTEWIAFDTNHHFAWVHLEVATVEHALNAMPVEVNILG